MQSVIVQCKACRNEFRGNYCNLCGEKVYKEGDKSVVHFASEGLHVVTHFEGTFLQRFATFLQSPVNSQNFIVQASGNLCLNHSPFSFY